MAEKDELKATTAVPAYDGADVMEGNVYANKDEAHLASLGYKQEFFRHLGLFENWAATFSSMNFISGIPVLFGWIMYTGGPTSAFANWTMVGGLSFIVSLSMVSYSLPNRQTHADRMMPCRPRSQQPCQHPAASTSGPTASEVKNGDPSSPG
jgi:hypothetical protein